MLSLLTMTNVIFCRTLYRLNSWSRLNVTVELFRTICTSDRITPRFLKIIIGLGRKLSSGDEDFMTCNSRFLTSSKKSGNNEYPKHLQDNALTAG